MEDAGSVVLALGCALARGGHRPLDWRRVECTVQEVSALYFFMHRGGLPRRFAYMASASARRWAGFGLNYTH